MHDVVHFHGTYRYATRENLEHAISSARAVLAEEESSERRRAEARMAREAAARLTQP